MVSRVVLVNPKLHRLGDAIREVGARAILEGEEPSARGLVGGGIVVLNEAPRPADHVEPHQFAPVVGVIALLERGKGTDRTLMTADELGLTQLSQQPLGTNAQVLVFGHEQAELAR